MGCCGCTNKTSVVTAGIMTMIQSAMFLSLNIYFLTWFYEFKGYSDRLWVGTGREILMDAISDHIPMIQGLLILATILHSAWLISSIAVLVRNSRYHITALRLWEAVTHFIIFGDILFMILVLLGTMPSILEANHELQKLLSHKRDMFERLFQADAIAVMWKYYILLIFTFTKLGPISLFTNARLCVHISGRISELTNPNIENVHAKEGRRNVEQTASECLDVEKLGQRPDLYQA